jgi:Protein of unknown function (DUF4013)
LAEHVPGWFNISGDGFDIWNGVLWFTVDFRVLLIGDVDLNLASFIIAAIFTSLFNAIFVMSLAHMAIEKSFTAAFQFKKIFGFIREVGWIKYLALIVFMTLLGGLINWGIEFISPFLVLPGWGKMPGVIVVTLLAYTYLFSFESRYAGLLYAKKP